MSKKEFTFWAYSRVPFRLIVQADSLEEAVDAAKEAPLMSLCFQCGKGEPDEWCPDPESAEPWEFDSDLDEVIGDNDEDLTEEARKLW